MSPLLAGTSSSLTHRIVTPRHAGGSAVSCPGSSPPSPYLYLRAYASSLRPDGSERSSRCHSMEASVASGVSVFIRYLLVLVVSQARRREEALHRLCLRQRAVD